MAEFWLEKPMFAISPAPYWHAVRIMGIQDRRFDRAHTADILAEHDCMF